MLNFKITVQYDGTRYNGWQRLGDDGNTIQRKIEDVLSRMTGHRVEINASGRTDKGVHALGQVANFKINTELTATDIKDYLMEEWNGEDNEISGTLDFYEESVVHYGLFDIGWTFLMDELENYGAYDLIERIRKIVEYDKYTWHDGTGDYYNDEEDDI
jgi:hypothetical protein